MATLGTNRDPLADLIAEYRRQVGIFNERAKHEQWETLLAATYGPALEILWRHTPEPNSSAGVLAAMQLAKDEPDLYALEPINAACVRYLQNQCPGCSAAEPSKFLSLCAALEASGRQELSFFRGGSNHIVDDDERDEALEPVYEERDVLVTSLGRLRATKPDDVLALAKALVALLPDLLCDETNDRITNDKRLVSLLLRNAAVALVEGQS